MRQSIQGIYLIALRAQGAYGQFFAAMMAARLPKALDRELHADGPAAIGVAGALLAVFLVAPRLTPGWLARPGGLLLVMPIMLAASLFAGLHVIMGFFAVIFFGIEEPAARALAMFAALPTLAFTSVISALGTVLCVWPAPRSPARA